ncbi:MAG: hypothetical protein L0Z53_24485 [Acidobacteriales bacterium]|nr:hypothetical protein [Terriglobales bacterium]
MRSLLSRLLLISFFVASLTWLSYAGESKGFTTNTNDDAVGEDCDRHFNVSYYDMEVFHAQEDRTIPKASITKLRVYGLRNGGIQVQGWDRDEIFIRACKAAAAHDESDARPLLDAMKLEVQGGDVTVSGLERNRAWVHLLVRVPKQLAMEFETHNGPLSFRKVDSSGLEATTTNGPVSLKDCTGKINVRVQNGPVSLVRSSGDIHLHAQNGPMSVELNENSWKGEGLEAYTRNGPLDLKIPAGYSSGVEVRADGHSPFSCRVDACAGADKDFDDNSRIVRFGKAGAPLVVRLSTVNGPVTIRRALARF